MYPKIYTFQEAVWMANKNIEEKKSTKAKRILLGNWFTQAYYWDFAYTTLFDAIKDIKENERIKKLFEFYGTSNFEEVLTRLKDMDFFSKIYSFDGTPAKQDYEQIQDSLAKAILAVHPEKTTVIPETNKKNCLGFLQTFDSIFTVNYDLLVYWVLLHDTGEWKFWDYFNRDENTPREYCEYFQDGSHSKKHVLFLHGALHLFLKDGGTIKKVWGNTLPLIQQIKDEMENWYYPLVVAEWSAENKLKMIKTNPYLYHAYSSLLQKGGQLFTFWFSFSKQDDHIVHAIINNPSIRHIWVWIRGDFSKQKNIDLYTKMQHIKESRKNIIWEKKETSWFGNVEIDFYDSTSADIWWEIQ